MGCVLTKEDYEEDLQKYSPSSSINELPLIKPIVTKRMKQEQKIKNIYYIEYNKHDIGRRTHYCSSRQSK